MTNKKLKKEELIHALKALKETIGWKIIEKVLDQNIKDAENKLFGIKDAGQNETIKLLQAKRKDRVLLKNLPDQIIKDHEDKIIFSPELDPYYKEIEPEED